jgi:spermidine synthase
VLPLLLVIFALSGAAGLIYEIVWLQLLELVIGSTAVSIAVLLGTFMGGLCLGSLLLPRWISARHHPLRVYAFLEFGTGACGFLALVGLPLIQNVYTSAIATGMPNFLLRGVACAICLLPPTLMMGATLPVVARWISSSDWGYFYGANTVGGVVGCFAAGFYLLRVFDMAIASYIAAGLNLVVGLVALWLTDRLGWQASAAPEGGWQWLRSGVLLAIGLSGLTALGAEVVWTRILSLILGPTVYTFSIILGMFLIGIGVGSTAGAWWTRKHRDARLWLGVTQFLLAAVAGFAVFMLADSLPYWPGNLLSTQGPWRGFLGDLLRAGLAVLPGALLWGASFPLALAAMSECHAEEDPGRVVGTVYGSNTIGAIVGAVLFAIILIPAIGTRDSNRVIILLSAAAGLVALWPVFNRHLLKICAGTAFVILLAWMAPDIPWKLIGFGRRLPTTTGTWDLLYKSEGINSSIAYSRWEGGQIYFHVAGKVEASTEVQDMSLQRLLGHLPALVHPNPKSVLVVGCGAGVTAGSFVVHPEVEKITICEIEPRIPPATAKYFARENHGVVNYKRTSVVFDDARHFVLTTPEKFDVITSDPIHPWVKGMATLYTTEYFEMVRRHLNPGGVVTQWVPLYESNLETVRSEIATFFEVFPNGSIWGNVNTDGSGYDVVLLGQEGKLHIDLDALQKRLGKFDYYDARQSIFDAGFNSGIDMLSTFAAQAPDLRQWLRGAAINRDRSLRLQYLAGLSLNTNESNEIYNAILKFARFPQEIFTGSAENVAQLKGSLQRRHF